MNPAKVALLICLLEVRIGRKNYLKKMKNLMAKNVILLFFKLE
jgi:hypothetical protein